MNYRNTLLSLIIGLTVVCGQLQPVQGLDVQATFYKAFQERCRRAEVRIVDAFKNRRWTEYMIRRYFNCRNSNKLCARVSKEAQCPDVWPKWFEVAIRKYRNRKAMERMLTRPRF